MNNQKFTLKKSEELAPRIATWYSQMEEVRENLLKRIKELDATAIDFSPDPHKIETIGTLLLHIAAIEWSWIFEDIDRKEMDYEEWKYAFALRPSVNLPQLTGQGKMFYLDRLRKVREEVYQRLVDLTDQDLGRIVGTPPQYSVEWILFHIIEHETMHIGQISLLKRLYDCCPTQTE